jgi:four helix bundle protein
MWSVDNLAVYRLARELAVSASRMTRNTPLSLHRSLADQIARAAVSITTNIAEAYALGTRAHLVRGVRIAFGSALELRTHRWIARRHRHAG